MTHDAPSGESAALFEAVAAGDLKRVRELLAETPSLATARDDEGATALHYAALHGHQDMARLLVQLGAEVNARDDRFGATPSGWAIEHLRELGGLLAIEVDALAVAVREGDVRWVRRLLARLPALAGSTDRSGTPLRQLAGECGSPEIARLFGAGS